METMMVICLKRPFLFRNEQWQPHRVTEKLLPVTAFRPQFAINEYLY